MAILRSLLQQQHNNVMSSLLYPELAVDIQGFLDVYDVTEDVTNVDVDVCKSLADSEKERYLFINILKLSTNWNWETLVVMFFKCCCWCLNASQVILKRKAIYINIHYWNEIIKNKFRKCHFYQVFHKFMSVDSEKEMYEIISKLKLRKYKCCHVFHMLLLLTHNQSEWLVSDSDM